MKKIALVLRVAVLSSSAAYADETPTEELKAPFGWTNCSSLTSGDSFNTTGGNNGTKVVTL